MANHCHNFQRDPPGDQPLTKETEDYRYEIGLFGYGLVHKRFLLEPFCLLLSAFYVTNAFAETLAHQFLCGDGKVSYAKVSSGVRLVTENLTLGHQLSANPWACHRPSLIIWNSFHAKEDICSHTFPDSLGHATFNEQATNLSLNIVNMAPKKIETWWWTENERYTRLWYSKFSGGSWYQKGECLNLIRTILSISNRMQQ